MSSRGAARALLPAAAGKRPKQHSTYLNDEISGHDAARAFQADQLQGYRRTDSTSTRRASGRLLWSMSVNPSTYDRNASLSIRSSSPRSSPSSDSAMNALFFIALFCLFTLSFCSFR